MYLSELKIWNFRKYGETQAEGGGELSGKPGLEVSFNPRLNVLIGENDSGKSAIIDAIKLILRTKSLDSFWVDDKDFHEKASGRCESLKIECVFKGFTDKEAGSFVEWIGIEENKFILKVWLVANRRDQSIQTRIKAGSDDSGALIDSEARDSLKTIYLKPLRDALAELTPGYRSRLAQILKGHEIFKDKKDDQGNRVEHKLEEKVRKANKQVSNYFEVQENEGNSEHEGEVITKEIKSYLEAFSFENAKPSPEFFMSKGELNEILKKLSLIIESNKSGLGSLNKLYMAAEFLLLNQSNNRSLKLALIEEIEAHLHPQAQLQVIDTLQGEDMYMGQLIMTTHSTTLASKIRLENLILCNEGDTFSMGHKKTALSKGDYAFLERFLDATKANLFFAKGVIFVEGDSENLLLPTIAKILDRQLHKFGVSIVNVGSTAFLRYSKIFERLDGKTLNIPVSILTDLDIPSKEYYSDSDTSQKNVFAIDEGNIDEFKSLSELVDFGQMVGVYTSQSSFEFALYEHKTGRFPRGQKKAIIEKFQSTKREITDEDIDHIRTKSLALKTAKYTSGKIAGFVAKNWTLEYELALSELKKVLYLSFLEAEVLQHDSDIEIEDIDTQELKEEVDTFFSDHEETEKKELAYLIFKPINDGSVSKAIIAQRLADNLLKQDYKEALIQSEELKYLRDAIYHVTKPEGNGNQE